MRKILSIILQNPETAVQPGREAGRQQHPSRGYILSSLLTVIQAEMIYIRGLCIYGARHTRARTPHLIPLPSRAPVAPRTFNVQLRECIKEMMHCYIALLRSARYLSVH